MKKIIRKGTFETNSSSSHSLVFCTEEEYKKLEFVLLSEDLKSKIITITSGKFSFIICSSSL